MAWLFVEAASDAMVIVDTDGTIMLVNTQMERLLGYERAELLGQSVEMLVPDATRPHHAGDRACFIADPSTRPMGSGKQPTGRRKDGTEVPVEVYLSAFDVDDEVIVSAAVRDVTERLADAAAAERDRMQVGLDRARRMESLGDLAGGVAHDFNNILAVVLNYAQFVEDEIAKTLATPEAERWAAAHSDIIEVRNATERAARLTRQLLSFARRDVNRPTVLDLAGVLGELKAMLQRTLGEHITLTINTEPGAPTVRIDPSQLEQVLLNLVVNARDAMPTGGRLTIDTSRLDADDDYAHHHPNITADTTYLCLRVTDTGTGIPDDAIDRVFEPFFSTKAETKGTGLGLATVYGVVTQAGGTVEVASDEGQGATFSILLPAIENADLAKALSPPSLAEATIILVVDDEPAVLEVARRVLADAGYQVLIANDGDEALATLTHHEGPIHLLLTDTVMPGLQGNELAEAALRIRPDTKVVLMSGYPQPLIGDGELDPTLRLLDKPFTRTTLLNAIHQAERA